MSMWKVNTESYKTKNGIRIGLISRFAGFEDSPQAEIISGGESTKDEKAVAIGRHGNFFMWGFAGSPDYMTEEAKLVFVNSIVYISKFDGIKPIARKYNVGIATTDYIDELIFNTTKTSYDRFLKFIEGLNKRRAKAKVRAQKKKDRGESLDRYEQMDLSSRPNPLPSREEYLERSFSKNRQLLYKCGGLDTLSIRKYLMENKSYFYSRPDDSNKITLDEEAKSLGVSIRDTKILDEVISLLEKNKNTEVANKILARYTTEEFETPKQWRKWYNKNKKKLFFTETGGYIWMVNPY